MKEKIRYTDEPMNVGRTLPDFLPPPEQLIFKEDAIKVTITLSARSVLFFKTEAEKRGVQYQRMIRRLLDAYVDAFETPDPAKGARTSDRVAQARAPYRKSVKAARAAKRR
jgi:hypothetical protein